MYVSSVQGVDGEGCGRSVNHQCKTLTYSIENVSRNNDDILIDGGVDPNFPLVYIVRKPIVVTTNLRVSKQRESSPSPVVTVSNTDYVKFVFHLKDHLILDFVVHSIQFHNISSLVHSELNGHIHFGFLGINNASDSIFKLACNNTEYNLHLHVENSEFYNCHSAVSCHLSMVNHIRFRRFTFQNFSNPVLNLIFGQKSIIEVIDSKFKSVTLPINITSQSQSSPYAFANRVTIRGDSFKAVKGGVGILFNNGQLLRLINTKFVSSPSTHSFVGMILNSAEDVEIRNCVFANHVRTNCTSVIANNVGRLRINHTIFTNNAASDNGGCICASNSVLFINATNFTRNRSGKGGAVYIDQSSAEITKSLFHRNSAGIQGGAVYSMNSNVRISSTNFTTNHAEYEGGALFYTHSKTSNTTTLVIHSSYFGTNSAKLFGGAVYVGGGTTDVTETTFSNNTAVLSGGGYYVERGVTGISSTSFNYNAANSSGGSIFQAGLSTSLHLQNSLVTSTDRNAGIIGTTIHSQNIAILRNVTIVMKLSKHDPLDALQGVLFPKSVIHKVTFSCSSNYRVTYKSHHRGNTNFTFLHAACIPCGRGLYTSLGSTVKFLTSNDTIEHQAKCRLCPNGGICTKFVVSRDNFWGYFVENPKSASVTAHKHVTFLPCPEKYCCSRETKRCTSFNTCNHNRNGYICGTCQHNFTLDYFSGQCVKQNSNCKFWLFWILFYAFVFVQSMFHMYFKLLFRRIKNCFKTFKKKLSGKVLTTSLSNLSSEVAVKDSEITGDCETVSVSSSMTSSPKLTVQQFSSYFKDSKSPYTTSTKRGRETKEARKEFESEENILNEEEGYREKEKHEREEEDTRFSVYVSGLKKNVFFFYQVVELLHVSPPTTSEQWLYPTMKKTFGAVFNFNFYIPFDLCPSYKLTAVGRELIRSSPVFFSIVVLAIMQGVYSCLFTKCNTKTKSNNKITFQMRVRLAFVELLLVGYVVITVLSFTLVHCVTINNEKRLYISGDIVCYRMREHYLLWIFIGTWVLPFGIAVGLGTMLLQKRKIQATGFYIFLAFPILFPYFFLVYLRTMRQPQFISQCDRLEINEHIHDDEDGEEQVIEGIVYAASEENRNDDTEALITSSSQFESEEVSGMIAVEEVSSTSTPFADGNHTAIEIERNHLLEIFQQPYRRERCDMEVIAIYIRLVLICITTLVINPVYRLILTFPVLLIFTFYHALRFPFRNKFLNLHQLVSLGALILLNLINWSWAYDYMNGGSPMPEWALFSLILSICQIIIVLLPSVGVLVLCLVSYIGKLFMVCLSFTIKAKHM